MWKIYEIRTLDKKVYVGCTSTEIGKRMAVHRFLKKEFVLQEHTIEIMFETDSNIDAHKFEAYLINKYDSTNPEKGYNRRYGGSRYGFPKYVKDAWSEKVKREGTFAGKKNPRFGRKQSEETKEKIRQKALARDPSTFEKNKIKTPEQLKQLQRGREKYQKIHGYPMSGRKHTDEAKQKIREAMMKK